MRFCGVIQVFNQLQLLPVILPTTTPLLIITPLIGYTFMLQVILPITGFGQTIIQIYQAPGHVPFPRGQVQSFQELLLQ